MTKMEFGDDLETILSGQRRSKWDSYPENWKEKKVDEIDREDPAANSEVPLKCCIHTHMFASLLAWLRNVGTGRGPLTLQSPTGD